VEEEEDEEVLTTGEETEGEEFGVAGPNKLEGELGRLFC